MSQVDDDFLSINGTSFKRKCLYYSTQLDKRDTRIIARSMLAPNGRPRLTFLVKTPFDQDEYTMLYLSDVDVIALISSLEESLYKHIVNYFKKINRSEVKEDAHTVNFEREELVSSIKSLILYANRNIVLIPEYASNPNINTYFGYQISFHSLCDVISFMLSTENEEKLKSTSIKYLVYASLIRGSAKGLAIPDDLKHVKTLSDVNEIYDKMRFTSRQEFDRKIFFHKNYVDYFQTAW